MKKTKLLYKDSGGNTLWEKQMKDKIQWFVKNKQGGLVDESGVRTMMHRAGYKFRKKR